MFVRKALATCAVACSFAVFSQAFAAERPQAEGEQGSQATPQDGTESVVVSTDPASAWPLASAIYADTTLRPKALGEDDVSALIGDAACTKPACGEWREMVARVSGDDAASRALLESIARRARVRFVVWLPARTRDAAQEGARVFDAKKNRFLALRLSPSPVSSVSPASAEASGAAPASAANGAWDEAIAFYKASLATAVAPDAGPETSKNSAWTKSPWLYAAIGGALAGAAAIFLATQGSSSDAGQPVRVRWEP